MKKILSALIASLLVLSMIPALAETAVTIGQVQAVCNGTRGFAIVTVAMQGDVIADAHIDEYQFMNAEGTVGVPNSDSDLGKNFPEGQVLASKRANNESYSQMMVDYAKATNTIAANYDAIEAFVTGKTVAELETLLAGTSAEAMVDAVASCTLADTAKYVAAVVEAAKAAK